MLFFLWLPLYIEAEKVIITKVANRVKFYGQELLFQSTCVTFKEGGARGVGMERRWIICVADINNFSLLHFLPDLGFSS